MSHISHVSRASHVSMGSRRPTLVQNTQDLDMEELLSIRLLRLWGSPPFRCLSLCDLMDLVQPRRYLRSLLINSLSWYLLISYIILWLLDLDWVHLIVDEAFCFQCAAAFVLGKLAPQDSAEPRVQAESSEKSSDKADRCMLKNPSATRSPTRSPSTISIYFTMPPLRSLRAHMLKPRDSRVRENGFMTGCGMMHFHISLFNVT